MKPHHVAALAQVGCYLMLPPTQDAIDSSCAHGATFPTLGDHVRGIAEAIAGGEECLHVHLRRFDMETATVAADAPLSQWQQGGEFERLDDCEGQLTRLLNSPAHGDATFQAATTGKLRKRWGDKAHGMATAMAKALDQQLAAARCVASDDPRLKEK
jgi:hypothetical protein